MKYPSQLHERDLAKAISQAVNTSVTTPEVIVDYAACLELHRAIRLPELLRIVGLGRSSWYGLLNPRSPTYDEKAPKPFRLGRAATAWWLHEVLAYVQQQSIASRLH